MASRSRSRSPMKQKTEEICNDSELHEIKGKTSSSRSSSPIKEKTEQTCNDSELHETKSRSSRENSCEKCDHLMLSRSRPSSPIKQKNEEICYDREPHETSRGNSHEKGDHLIFSQSRSSSPIKEKTEETCNDSALHGNKSRASTENSCEKGDHLMLSRSRSSSAIKDKTEEICNDSELHENKSRSSRDNSCEKGDYLMLSRSRSSSPIKEKTEQTCNDNELHETKSRSSRENSCENQLMLSQSRPSSPIKQKNEDICNDREPHETSRGNSQEKGDQLMLSQSRSSSPINQKTEEICNDREPRETKSRSSRENSHEKGDHLMIPRSRSSSPIKEKSEETCNDSELHETKSRSSRENSCERDYLWQDELENLYKKFKIKNRKTKNRLFISNMPLTWTKDDVIGCVKSLIEKFEMVPQKKPIHSLDITKEFVEGTLKNSCTLLFKSRRATVLAYHQLKKVEVEGKKLEVKAARQLSEIEETNIDQVHQYSNPTNVEKENSIINPTEPDIPKNFKVISRKLTKPTETYGLSWQFLSSLGIKPPLCPRIVVSNLAPNVTDAKIKEVFSMAGLVLDAGITTDNSKKAVVNYDHPLEAVQAVSMFNGQLLHGWAMHVEMDRRKLGYKLQLPSGLAGVGPGLGPCGDVLRKAREHADLLSLRQVVQSLWDKHQTRTQRHPVQSNARDHSPWDTGSNPNPGNSLDTNTQILNLLQALVKQQTSTPPAAPVQHNMQSTPSMFQHNMQTTPQMNQLNIQAPAPMDQHNMQAPPPMVQQNMQTTPPMVQQNMQITPPMVQHNMQAPPPVVQHNMQAPPLMVQQNMQAPPPMVQQNMQAPPQMNQHNMQVPSPMVQQNMQTTPTTFLHNMHASAPSVQPNMQAPPPLVQQTMQVPPPMVQQKMQTTPPMNQHNMLATPRRVHNMQASAPSASLEKPSANTMIQYPVRHKETGAGQQGKPQSSYSDAGLSNKHGHSTTKRDQLGYDKKDSKYEPSNKRARVEDTSKYSKLIVIRHLPPYVTLEALKEKMSEVGKLEFVKMTGPGRALLRYISQRDADTCIQLFDRSKVDGQVIEVKYF